MRLRSVSYGELVDLVVARSSAPGSALIIRDGKWDIVIAERSEQELIGTRFGKSVRKNVDSNDKKASYLSMLKTLFASAEQDDFYEFINESGKVICKEAHKFSFRGRTERVLELKRGKQDRIYLYRLDASESPNGRSLLLIMAYYKTQSRTPRDVCDACEKQIKEVLGVSSN
jgi:hypothetical protein